MPVHPVVSTQWLREHLDDPHVRVLDASWYLASMNRDPRREFREGHIPGAQLFSIDDASDPASPLPHTFPPAAQFSEVVSRLGVSSSDHVVVYDASGTNFSAPRAWWMFRAFGHDDVSVLDGGLAAWKDTPPDATTLETGALEFGDPLPPPRGTFNAVLRTSMLRSASQVHEAPQQRTAQLVDMRSRGRFEGSEPEPRPGLRGGHIPGARNLPYAHLVDDRGLLRSPPELHAMLESAGIDLGRPVIASCGSGVTACSLLLALDVLGVGGTALYDGSWSEWGQRHELPVETGSPR
jgi:thiosulfate/3-mercaptopyruvate sulfurtransferase